MMAAKLDFKEFKHLKQFTPPVVKKNKINLPGGAEDVCGYATVAETVVGHPTICDGKTVESVEVRWYQGESGPIFRGVYESYNSDTLVEFPDMTKYVGPKPRRDQVATQWPGTPLMKDGKESGLRLYDFKSEVVDVDRPVTFFKGQCSLPFCTDVASVAPLRATLIRRHYQSGCVVRGALRTTSIKGQDRMLVRLSSPVTVKHSCNDESSEYPIGQVVWIDLDNDPQSWGFGDLSEPPPLPPIKCIIS